MKNVLAALNLATVLVACASEQTDDDDPEAGDAPVAILGVSEVQSFDNLDDLVSSSDLVVEGRVLRVAEGDLRGADAGDGRMGILFAETTVAVERVLGGSLAGDQLVIESMGWTSLGRPLVFADGSTHNVNQVGERAIFHLVKTRRDDDRVLYRLTSSQGKYVVDGGGALHATVAEDTLAAQIQVLGADELRRRIHTVASRVPIQRRDPVY